MDRIIALIALAAVLGIVNWSIAGKEQHLAEGDLVYLEIAPVDPRSLMQGDYMALRFQVADSVYGVLPKSEERRRWRRDVDASDGHAVVRVDQRKVGEFVRLHDGEPLAEDEVLMRYRVRNGEVRFATNAFFFQEGHAEHFEPARYGAFRVDDGGELLLVTLHGENLQKLEPTDD